MNEHQRGIMAYDGFAPVGSTVYFFDGYSRGQIRAFEIEAATLSRLNRTSRFATTPQAAAQMALNRAETEAGREKVRRSLERYEKEHSHGQR